MTPGNGSTALGRMSEMNSVPPLRIYQEHFEIEKAVSKGHAAGRSPN
jgi:hypothetical protein